MKTAGGGGSAATSGLYFQFLVTLEHMLDLLEASDPDLGLTVYIESHPSTAEHPDELQHIVDFSMADSSGEIIKMAQVKSVAEPGNVSSRLTAPSALDDVLRLVAVGQAHRYLVITNAALTGPAQQVARVLSDRSLAPAERRARLIGQANRPDLRRALEVGADEMLARLGRSRIVVDPRSPTELRNDLRERFRR